MVRAGTQASGTYSSCALIFPRYAGDGRRFRHGARGGAFLALLLPKPPVQRPGASLVSCILQDFRSALGRTRTCDLLIRSQTLYPAELRAREVCLQPTYHMIPSGWRILKAWEVM